MFNPKTPPIISENQAYRNFVFALRSPKTRSNYLEGLKYYMRYLRINDNDYDALLKPDPKTIQANIIEFTIYCKTTRQLAPATVAGYITGVHKFYDMNDVDLRWKRIASYQDQQYRVVEDRAYTHEEIKKMIDIASIRDKAIILLMASTGVRVGGVPTIRMKDLQEINAYGGLYKITVYVRYKKDEYFTYCTPEARDAIDNYLAFRRRCNERFKDETPLFRKEFDKENSEQVAAPLPITTVTIYNAIWALLEKTGIRMIQKMTEEDRAMRKPPKRTELQACHAFKKFAITNMIRAKLDFNMREKLTSHKVVGLDQHYERLDESEFLEEYSKAIDFLTINNEARLAKQVDRLELNKSDLLSRMEKLEAHFNNILSSK